MEETSVYMREGTTSRVMASGRPYGEFYDIYSTSLEYFEYHLVHQTNIALSGLQITFVSKILTQCSQQISPVFCCCLLFITCCEVSVVETGGHIGRDAFLPGAAEGGMDWEPFIDCWLRDERRK
jgi:hypothetical protein